MSLICRHAELCGGCQYSGMDYEKVLSLKEAEVRGYMKEHLAQGDFVFDGIEGCPEGARFRYRNKMEYTFGDLTKGGELQLGMHKKGNYMSVVTVDSCLLVPEDFNRILRYTLDFAVSRGIPHYNKKSHRGVLRNLIVRRGVRTRELLIDIVTSSEADGLFDAEAWSDGLFRLGLDDEIAGVMHTVNDGLADAVNCDEQRIIFGRDFYYEEICGLRFRVGIFSFFQTNVEAVERLYTKAVGLLEDLDGKVVYDLFCGTGTISQIAAKRAREVIGVEIVEDSVDAARVNTKLNGIDNCRFICGDVFKVLSAASDGEGDIPGPDVIIVDPPRMGLRTAAANKIASYGVPEILYISCNPKTMAQDLSDLRQQGYKPVYMKAFDNFCWTKHVETVCCLYHQKKDFISVPYKPKDDGYMNLLK